MTPGEDKIRVELSIGELLHLTSLAHLGFKKMMPNDRGIEMHRFDGEEHALEGTRAVARLEWAIPEKHRPSDHSGNRQALIRHWWPLGELVSCLFLKRERRWRVVTHVLGTTCYLCLRARQMPVD